mgnify:CR=1 FL=1
MVLRLAVIDLAVQDLAATGAAGAIAATVRQRQALAQGRFDESAGWRILVGALWTGILVLSLLGLRSPLVWSPVLVLQVIYKSLWLGAYALPRVVRGDPRSVPPGIAGSFAVIVLVWPWIIPWRHLLAG